MESANVVGYNNTEARANFNWYTPMFLTVGANTIDINAVQLVDVNQEGMIGYGDSMQIVGPLGNPETTYAYWSDPSMDLSGKATGPFWSDDQGNSVEVSFDSGDGIAIDNANALTFAIQTAGQVPTGDVQFNARANFNWSGNPFPAPISINAIQLVDVNQEGMIGYGDSMQIVGPLGNPETTYAYWSDPSMDLSGKATGPFWSDANGNSVEVTLQPGAGFAIDNANGLTFDIKIACPY